eukprot:TRINITY_DN11_c0_g4_i3.p1 TRINITY_DN11_c0_g4~~TRINITY_DN11_c0_g4_i3.p1  ORF type:complete len:304 (-),score=81.43 TRINITY_DN11_c0_g4_i3:120-1031(-)
MAEDSPTFCAHTAACSATKCPSLQLTDDHAIKGDEAQAHLHDDILHGIVSSQAGNRGMGLPQRHHPPTAHAAASSFPPCLTAHFASVHLGISLSISSACSITGNLLCSATFMLNVPLLIGLDFQNLQIWNVIILIPFLFLFLFLSAATAMGRCPHNKAGGQQKKFLHKSARREKFLKKGDDMVYDELANKNSGAAATVENNAQGDTGPSAASAPSPSPPAPSAMPLNEDLPGMGQWYCLHCDRYFANAAIRDEHYKTKLHKKRVKLMKGPRPHSQLDAEMAAGMGPPDNGPKLRMDREAVMAL